MSMKARATKLALVVVCEVLRRLEWPFSVVRFSNRQAQRVLKSAAQPMDSARGQVHAACINEPIASSCVLPCWALHICRHSPPLAVHAGGPSVAGGHISRERMRLHQRESLQVSAWRLSHSSLPLIFTLFFYSPKSLIFIVSIKL
jgi:hypothetical protein